MLGAIPMMFLSTKSEKMVPARNPNLKSGNLSQIHILHTILKNNQIQW